MNDANSLSGLTVALAESRELDLLARMVEERGGRVWRCPLVAIVDAPDEAAVQAWIGRMIAREFDLFILFTGEGLRRLLAAAGRSQREAALVAALADTEILCRGPKPVRELRRLGLKPRHQASTPTTQGVIETLEQLDLRGRRITLQLYGSDPNPPLIDHLAARGIVPVTVAPYAYAPKSDEMQVVALIDALAQGGVDALLFTSQPQYRRLVEVAQRHDRGTQLAAGLERIKVGAIGPVMADLLHQQGVRVDFMPEARFFMKPLVSSLVRHTEGGEPA